MNILCPNLMVTVHVLVVKLSARDKTSVLKELILPSVLLAQHLVQYSGQ